MNRPFVRDKLDSLATRQSWLDFNRAPSRAYSPMPPVQALGIVTDDSRDSSPQFLSNDAERVSEILKIRHDFPASPPFASSALTDLGDFARICYKSCSSDALALPTQAQHGVDSRSRTVVQAAQAS